MPQALYHFHPGNLGNVVGAASDGVILGALTPIAPTKFFLRGTAAAGLCITDDGGLYVDETAALASATADDVEVLPATPADDDAVYFGHATVTFSGVDVNLTTVGSGTWDIVWEYWDGSQWTALQGVVDGTDGFTDAGTGWKTLRYTVPTDWAKCLVDNTLAYWVRGVVDNYSAVTTAPQVGQGYVMLTTAADTDDTTDFGDADAGDTALLPAYPVVGDAAFIGHSEKFCKLKVTTSQAGAGTYTLTYKYWNGAAWATLSTIEDDSVAWTATAGTHLIHFQPPTDWVANATDTGPGGAAGFFIKAELTALTSMTTQPLATRGWVLPVTTGASGFCCPATGTITRVSAHALTASASNADSKFIILNATKGTSALFTWTKATVLKEQTVSLAVTKDDKLLLVHVTEDGTTEYANAQFQITLAA